MRTREEIIEKVTTDVVDVAVMRDIISDVLYWERVYRMADIDVDNWEETLNLDGYDVFSKVRNGRVDLTKEFITFDGSGNFVTKSGYELKVDIIDCLEKMSEEEFERFMEIAGGYL